MGWFSLPSTSKKCNKNTSKNNSMINDHSETTFESSTYHYDQNVIQVINLLNIHLFFKQYTYHTYMFIHTESTHKLSNTSNDPFTSILQMDGSS